MTAQTYLRPIYLDYCATTPVDPRVLSAMLPYFVERFANAASQGHALGREVREAVESAREVLARLVGCAADDVIWTSGATESNNLAVKYVAGLTAGPHHIITQATEHKAVLDPVHSLERSGIRATILDVDQNGCLDPEAVAEAIRPETRLVSVMWANNETGTLMPIAQIGQICKAANCIFHCDASQAIGKTTVDVKAACVDLLSVSAHKFYGPKGIGALVFRRSAKIRSIPPIIEGGGHERGIRSGTLNVPGIVGLGMAAELALREGAADCDRIFELRSLFENGLFELGGVDVNGGATSRIATVSNLSFRGIDGESLLIALNEIAASTGSACTTASLEPSHVLRAMRLSPERQRGAVRFSFGRQTTVEEINRAIRAIKRAVPALRSLSEALI